jgi:hypothetical protein
MTADEAVARAGSLAWEAEVVWSVGRDGAPAQRTTEHHRLRQLATGEFDVSSDVDPGGGPGSETGKQIIFTKSMTYARGRWAPFRERSDDRGVGARRFRDQSFRMAADLADLFGPGFTASPAGETTFAGRPARRFTLSLSGAKPKRGRTPPGLPDGGYDPDTKKRVAFLEGRVPSALEGELLLDAATGVPLQVTMKGTLSQEEDALLRAEVALDARVKALGAEVPSVSPPNGALADERKPKGVARALEAAGLRKRGAEAEEREGADEAEEAEPDER